MSFPETITTPGLVDLHVHYRDPSSNHAETIASGTRAALLGGYVLTCDMPNNPGNPTWTEIAMLQKHVIARAEGYIPTGFYAGWQPDSAADITELTKMSHMAVGLKLYGAPTTGNEKDHEAADFLEAIGVWDQFAPEKPIMFHAGKHNLADMISLVAKDFDHHLHVCHVSSSEEVELVKQAKQADLPVTCGVCPHHLLKTSHDTRTEGWFARMQPPLASQDEAEKLMSYLADGDIDIVETDHAPHSTENKEKAEAENPDNFHKPWHTTCFGVPGIEFAAPLMFYQAKRGFISMRRVINAMSTRPAEIIGVRLSPNTKVEWDMREYRLEEEMSTVHSQARWTPYLGKLLVGVPRSVTVGRKMLISGEEHIVAVDPRVITDRGSVI